MGRFIQNILRGASQVLVLWPENDYVRPQRGAFAEDAKKLRKDAAQVAYGLRQKAKSNGKQINHS